jgi:hypothetical protein
VSYDGSDRIYVVNDAGKQPKGLAFYGSELYYADSAFDSIEYATIEGNGQPPTFAHFKTNVENLVNIKAISSNAGMIYLVILSINSTRCW